MGDPSLAVSRYFLSQMSSDASWKEMASMSLGSIFTTVFMNPWRSDMFTPQQRISGAWPATDRLEKRATGAWIALSQSPEPPPIVNLESRCANTRSCVGVKRLMRWATVVKACGRILLHRFRHYKSDL